MRRKIFLIPKVFYLYTRSILRRLILKYCMYSVLLQPFNDKIIRPILWRFLGCKVGKNSVIGYDIYFDEPNAKLITIGERVMLSNRCLLLCHKRDLQKYFCGLHNVTLPYISEGITLCDGTSIGMGTIILPGVTIGEGTVVGAGSVVTKSLPPWVIAAGNPAKVIRLIEKIQKNEN